MTSGWRFRRFSWTRNTALAVLVLAGLVLAGCANRVLPPYIERSPVRVPEEQHRIFVPAMLATPVKFGAAGCPASCDMLGCSWCYSWSLAPGLVSGVETVGMVWDETHVEDGLNASSGWVLGFNEPDLAGQANLTPAQAVGPWARVEERFRAFRLVCPAPSHLHPEWLGQFYEAFRAAKGRYPDCDALAVHCYWNNAARCIADTQARIAEAKRRGVGEVWVTEFFFSEQAEARAFASYLESEPMVTRWSPFVSRLDCADAKKYGYWDCVAGGDPSLLRETGQLTAIGAWYARPTPEW